ncbi:HlyD family secretion protein [Pseudoalteromonas fenneropenaei]|uniref:HlyD family secretion protein n=1 Tax=Pseudoalteromonas fenneropenaei TaxID=1737459 RepID=A0ABV7CJM4_9GAMM
MTPDQKFARWVKFACIGFAAVFAYFLVADLTMPMTPQAMATRVVTKVAPRINGQLAAVYVTNNQPVAKGELLFELDPTPFQLAVEQAELNVARVQQNNAQIDAAIVAAKAQVRAATIIAEQKQREATRLNTLYAQSGTSLQQRDDAQSAATAAQANVLSAQAKLQELEVNRGDLGESNVNLQVALNQLKQAKLNLSYTQVIAEHDGVVTNLQLEPGAYAAAGVPLIALVASDVDVIADFREKNLRHIASQTAALVAFDSKPGQVFTAKVSSLDAGVSNGQFDANGRLATPTESNRWVRDAQRMRLHLAIDDPQIQTLPAGARATVQLLPTNPLLNWLAHAQIRMLSTLHFIY